MSNVIGKPDLIVIDSVWKELDDLSRGKRASPWTLEESLRNNG